ncbi:hypothetical protein OPV22_023938 [Ensete ventricosum]|uniref:Uncharacterized protein n=1 Tax=Ensete ventricosum TaxID=4639 RepID=A0AAV8PFS5_ENSVE|nr:hypothetical protein OPV22_023938 [Ensete ventricosum]
MHLHKGHSCSRIQWSCLIYKPKSAPESLKVGVIMTKVPEEFLELLPGNKLMQVLNSLPCIPFVKKAAQMILKNLIPGVVTASVYLLNTFLSLVATGVLSDASYY